MTYAQELEWFLRSVRRRWAGVVVPEVMARALAGVGLVILAGGATARVIATYINPPKPKRNKMPIRMIMPPAIFVAR